MTDTTLRNWSLTRTESGLATLTLDKAAAAVNTLSADVMAELDAVLTLLDATPPTGLVIRSGKRNGFIAGADIEEFRRAQGAADAIAIVRRGATLFDRLARVPYPTLALISGFCLGGGLELALACRYRIAVDDPSTRMGLPEVMLGIVPGWGGIKRLPRLIGAPAALDLLLSGRSVDARTAKRLGIVDEAVPQRVVDNAVAIVMRGSPPARSLPLALSLTLQPLARRLIAGQAAKKVARRARREHYPAPYTIL
ncbi:MAG: enoyl-CoA hydratase-related protein, partial [Casimicrobiaceae bacterium]